MKFCQHTELELLVNLNVMQKQLLQVTINWPMVAKGCGSHGHETSEISDSPGRGQMWVRRSAVPPVYLCVELTECIG